MKKNNLRKSINESVKQFIMEFGSGNSEKAKENRKKMAMASKRAIDKGDDSVYHNSVRSITTGGGSKSDLGDFNDEFEKLNSQPANNLTNEGKNQIKVSESQLLNIIEESVMRILKEAADHKITYNGQDYTLNAGNQSSWYKLGDIRKDMAKPYKQMADDADDEADRISDQEGFHKDPQLMQQYIDARNRRSQNNAIADKYQQKAWRNNDNGYGIARRDLERFNQHLDNYFGARK